MNRKVKNTASFQSKMNQIASTNGLILVYHSISEAINVELESTLHNVTPSVFEQQILSLSDYFKFVSLSEFINSENKHGLACITFDDGYKNVVENALPILKRLNYYSCLFLNPITLSKSWNWRDKVRAVIAQRLESRIPTTKLKNSAGRFYRYSKNPVNNSLIVDHILETIPSIEPIKLYGKFPYLTKDDLPIAETLIEYGNHGYNHYVLSSLDPSQQYEEIRAAQRYLTDCCDLQLSDCFAVAFGGTNDINGFTLNSLQKSGYKSLLMSRQQLQEKPINKTGINIYERVLPRKNDIISQIIDLYQKNI